MTRKALAHHLFHPNLTKPVFWKQPCFALNLGVVVNSHNCICTGKVRESVKHDFRRRSSTRSNHVERWLKQTHCQPTLPIHSPKHGRVLCISSRMYESRMSAAAMEPPRWGTLAPVLPLRQLMPLLMLHPSESEPRGEQGGAAAGATSSCPRWRFLRRGSSSHSCRPGSTAHNTS